MRKRKGKGVIPRTLKSALKSPLKGSKKKFGTLKGMRVPKGGLLSKSLR